MLGSGKDVESRTTRTTITSPDCLVSTEAVTRPGRLDLLGFEVSPMAWITSGCQDV